MNIAKKAALTVTAAGASADADAHDVASGLTGRTRSAPRSRRTA